MPNTPAPDVLMRSMSNEQQMDAENTPAPDIHMSSLPPSNTSMMPILRQPFFQPPGPQFRDLNRQQIGSYQDLPINNTTSYRRF